MVGTVDEDFAVESLRGDIMLLGNTSWRIRRVESSAGRLLVEDAHGAAPSVPFWRGEAPPRTPELSAGISEIRQRISNSIPDIIRDLASQPQRASGRRRGPGPTEPEDRNAQSGAPFDGDGTAAAARWLKDEWGSTPR